MSSSKSNYLPNTSFPNTMTLGNRASTYEFCGDTNTQSITTLMPLNLSSTHILVSKILFSTKRKQSSLNKRLILGLGQRKYKLSLKFFLSLQVKKGSRIMGKYQKNKEANAKELPLAKF